MHALSEEEYNENKSNTFPSSAMYVDISDRLVEWIDDWRDARGKSLRRAFQDERDGAFLGGTERRVFYSV